MELCKINSLTISYFSLRHSEKTFAPKNVMNMQFISETKKITLPYDDFFAGVSINGCMSIGNAQNS